MKFSDIKKLMFRKKESHKGEHGFVLVVGGSEDYIGTLVLVGIAALRSGCDLVTVAAPEKVAWAINCHSLDLITKKLKGKFLSENNLPAVKKLLTKFNVLEFGNGICSSPETKKFAEKLMNLSKNKLKVIDADGIKLLSLKQINNAIITPHAKELEILLNNSGLDKINRINNKDKKAKEIQKHLDNNVLIWKGPEDFIISKNKIIKVKGGNPGMGRAGMGDVLAGLCAGFLSQSKDLMKSAEAASYLNKELGSLLLKKKIGYSFIASDMLDLMEKLKKKRVI